MSVLALILLFTTTSVAPRYGAVTGTVERGWDPADSTMVFLNFQCCAVYTDAQGRYLIPNVPAGPQDLWVDGVPRAKIVVAVGETLQVRTVHLRRAVATHARHSRVRGLVAGSPCPIHKHVRLVEYKQRSHDFPRLGLIDESGYALRHFALAEGGDYQFPYAIYLPDSAMLGRTVSCPVCLQALKEHFAAVRRMRDRTSQSIQTIDLLRWEESSPQFETASAGALDPPNDKTP